MYLAAARSGTIWQLQIVITNTELGLKGTEDRSSYSQMSFKIGVLKNFAIFTGLQHFWWLLMKRKKVKLVDEDFTQQQKHGVIKNYQTNTTWNVSVFGVFLIPIFPHSDQKNFEYRHFLSSVIDSKSFRNFVTHNFLSKWSLSTHGNNKQNRLREC